MHQTHKLQPWNSSTGENLAKLNPVKDYVIYDDKVYYIHHIYDRFAASKDGSIFNLQTKQRGIGYIENKSGCYRFTAFTKEYIEKGKCYYNHRFIWEAINKQSLSKNVIIRHIDGNKLNNSIDNLELGKRKMNEKCIQARYDAMMKKIENGNFPYQKQLQEHFPNMNFY